MLRRLLWMLPITHGSARAEAEAPPRVMNVGHEGCPPGYWLHHLDSWREADPGDLFSDTFGDGTSGVLDGITLDRALVGGDDIGLPRAELTLARAATAALLNAAHEDVGYPWQRDSRGTDGRPPLVPTVKEALDSGNPGAIFALTSRLDMDNNLDNPFV
jgi:hypothetical protein